MTQTGGKRKINPTLRAWIQHVRKVAQAENLPYGKEAMKKAKQGKYGQQWKAISASVKKGQKGGIYIPNPMIGSTKGTQVSPIYKGGMNKAGTLGSAIKPHMGGSITDEEEGTTTSESIMETEDMTNGEATGTMTTGGRRRRTRRGSRGRAAARSMRRGRAAGRGRSRARY